MSARRLDIDVSPLAQRDIRSIALYTQRVWGAAQRSVYIGAIERAFSRLRTNPYLGRDESSVATDLRGLRVRQHVIYYQVDATSVTIFRILHEQMDARSHLARELDELPE